MKDHLAIHSTARAGSCFMLRSNFNRPVVVELVQPSGILG